MITEDLPGSPAYARAKKLWGEYVRSSEAGESLSAPLTGTIDAAIADWMDGRELTFAALEVGTRPMRQVLSALRNDNWLHMHGAHGRCARARHQGRDPRRLLSRYG